jgi:hypothetical protein
MVADSRLFRPTAEKPPEADEPILLHAARRGATAPALLPPQEEVAQSLVVLVSGGTGQSFLQDYAIFVLEQEAEYCQQ